MASYTLQTPPRMAHAKPLGPKLLSLKVTNCLLSIPLLCPSVSQSQPQDSPTEQCYHPLPKAEPVQPLDI